MLLLCRWNTFGGVCRWRFEATGGFCEYRDGFTLRRISKRPFLHLFNAFWPFGHVYRTVFLIPRQCFSGRTFFTNCENFGSRKRAEKIVPKTTGNRWSYAAVAKAEWEKSNFAALVV